VDRARIGDEGSILGARIAGLAIGGGHWDMVYWLDKLPARGEGRCSLLRRAIKK